MRLNAPIALASVLLSIMLWLVVYAQNVPEPIPVRASLAFDGLDESRFFVRKAPDDVRLDLSIPSDRAKELSDQKVTASVDLSDAEVGAHEYPVAISPPWVVRYLAQARPRVSVAIEAVDTMTISVTTMVKGALRDPLLRLNEKRVLPDRVTLTGPASEIATVREARAYLDLSRIDPQRPEYQESRVIPLDAKEARPPHVHVTPEVVVNAVSVGPSPTTKVAAVTPDLTGVTYSPKVLPGGYRLSPETVTLAGKPAVLANVSKVPTEIVRARGLGRNQTFRVRLLAPEGTMIVGPERCDVTVLVLPGQPPKTEPTVGASVATTGTPPR